MGSRPLKDTHPYRGAAAPPVQAEVETLAIASLTGRKPQNKGQQWLTILFLGRVYRLSPLPAARAKTFAQAAERKILKNGSRPGLAGDELFAFRKTQIKETLAWRRDHLVEALQAFFAQLDGPKANPLEACSKDWNLLNAG